MTCRWITLLLLIWVPVITAAEINRSDLNNDGTVDVSKANTSQVTDKSDLNGDGVIDLADLSIFSTNYLDIYWENVDWCVFHGSTLAGADFEGRSTKYYLRHFPALLGFINQHFNCGGGEPPPNNLILLNAPRFLARIADATALS